jgi:hypothetical protein
MVLHLLNFGSTEKTNSHLLSFQSSAARSQACAANIVHLIAPGSAKLRALAVFRRNVEEDVERLLREEQSLDCENRAKTVLRRPFNREVGDAV